MSDLWKEPSTKAKMKTLQICILIEKITGNTKHIVKARHKEKTFHFINLQEGKTQREG
jgi:hypothetical protein